jgi:hypothetical protein
VDMPSRSAARIGRARRGSRSTGDRYPSALCRATLPRTSASAPVPTGAGNRDYGGNRFHRRRRGTEDERSGECGRARDAGSQTEDATQTQTCNAQRVCVCAASFVRVTAGSASRRPHESPTRLVTATPFLSVISVTSVPLLSIPRHGGLRSAPFVIRKRHARGIGA